MSDTSQGPGWWQASDGRWYPPESHPDAQVRVAKPEHPLCPNGHPTAGTPFCPMCGAAVADAAVQPEEVEGADSDTELHDFETGSGPVPAHRHPNGGGWVANTATVSTTAFVGPSASVFEEAKVIERASVDGTAWVLGKAQVSGSARIRGNAEIGGHAHVTDKALVTGSALITDLALIKDSAVVSGDARIGGQSTISGNMRVGGDGNTSVDEAPAVPPPPGLPAGAKPETSGPAIASLVLGILWLGGLGSVLALIFGYTGNRTIKRSGGAVTGRGLAIAGIVLGWVGLVSTLAVGGLVTLAVVRNANQLTIDGQPVTFSVHRFTDPASDQENDNSSNNSDHYATVSLEMTDKGSSSLTNLPVTVIAYGQHGAVYESTTTTPDGDQLCPSGTASTLNPNEPLLYCLGFVLPESDTVSRVEVSVDQSAGSGTETFDVPDSFTGWANN